MALEKSGRKGLVATRGRDREVVLSMTTSQLIRDEQLAQVQSTAHVRMLLTVEVVVATSREVSREEPAKLARITYSPQVMEGNMKLLVTLVVCTER